MKRRTRGAPGGPDPLARLRRLFLVFSLVNCALVAGMLLSASASGRAGAFGAVALAALTCWWIRGYRRGFPWPADIGESVALLAIAATLRIPETALGLYYVAVYFRSLYDHRRRVLARAGLFLAALAVALARTPVGSLRLPSRLVPHVVGFLVAALVMNALSVLLVRHEQALARERVLRRLAAELARTRERTTMYKRVCSASLALADGPGVRSGVALGTADEMEVVATRGAGAGLARGGRVRPRILLAGLLDDLRAGRAVVARGLDAPGCSEALSFAARSHALFAPLLSDGQLVGWVVVSSSDTLSSETLEALEIVASYVSVWLEGLASREAAERSEARFRSLVQESTDIIAVVDSAGVLTYASPSVTSTLGYDPGALMGTSGLSFVHPDDLERVAAALVASASGSGSTPPVEFRARDAQGSWRCIEATLSNLLEHEHVRGIVVNAHDVTDRRRVEDELHRSLTLLRETDAARKRLLRNVVVAQEEERKAIAADIHDDSVQEMSAVVLRLGMLRRYVEDPRGLEALTRVEDEVSGAIGRLRKLMFGLRPPALDHEGLAAAVRDSLRQLSDDLGIQWDVRSRILTEPSPEIRVTAYRIVQEALANVRKHAKAAEVRVSIEPADGGICLHVVDDGVGFVMNGDHTAAGPGHFGLKSMSERAELAGGLLRVDSYPGRGTSVHCFLPDGPAGFTTDSGIG